VIGEKMLDVAKLELPTLKNTSQAKVPFVNLGLQYLSLRNEILYEFDRLSQKGSYILGEEVDRFEKELAHYCETQYAISIGNGGDALFLTLKALGVGVGDEVITAANSFIASAWAIADTGAKVVYADVGADYNLDPKEFESKITSKTKAVMPVHLTGRPAAMDEILATAKKHNLFVIEDAAQAIGARYKGKRVGGLSNAGCFSLHPLKNLHVHGDGGAVVTNDKNLDHKLRLLRNHGLVNRDECVMWGHNSRLDTIQAAIASLKLKKLDEWNGRFREIAARYQAELNEVVEVPKALAHEECIYHRFIVMVNRREELQAHLLKEGIETKVNYPIPLHLQPVSREMGYGEGNFPVTEAQAKKILSLPIYAEMTDAQVDLVIQGVKSFYSKGMN